MTTLAQPSFLVFLLVVIALCILGLLCYQWIWAAPSDNKREHPWSLGDAIKFGFGFGMGMFLWIVFSFFALILLGSLFFSHALGGATQSSAGMFNGF